MSVIDRWLDPDRYRPRNSRNGEKAAKLLQRPKSPESLLHSNDLGCSGCVASLATNVNLTNQSSVLGVADQSDGEASQAGSVANVASPATKFATPKPTAIPDEPKFVADVAGFSGGTTPGEQKGAVGPSTKGGEWDASDWSDFYEERTAHRECGGLYPRAEAEALAWGELENRWHAEHGDHIPRDLCAGCRKPIGGAEALDLIDGNRVHFANNDCLIRHSCRWRGNATAALLAMGLTAPTTEKRERDD
jgi:hypothetical protein